MAELNEELLATAVAARVAKTGKVRADTTVVSANVQYPTDSGLLARAVVKIGRLVQRIKTVGAAPRMRFHGCGRAAATRVRAIALSLHLRGAAAREEAHRTVARITGELPGLLDQATAEAATVLRNARRSLPRTAGRARSRLHRAANEPNRPDLAGYHSRQAQGVRAFETRGRHPHELSNTAMGPAGSGRFSRVCAPRGGATVQACLHARSYPCRAGRVTART
ncbi:hypothetical protein ABT369_57390 [Dactylosporangium sp. NPDC000244]|uniref:hypothetical protein n=1 Tax=Dactylosporangium sp. NPDC000244 TaxID=3154365 RepID=UPI0033312434